MEQGEVADTLMLPRLGLGARRATGQHADARLGALIGEIEVLNPGFGRMATITAEADTTCIVVTRTELLEGLAEDPQAAVALLEILAGRFRETAFSRTSFFFSAFTPAPAVSPPPAQPRRPVSALVPQHREERLVERKVALTAGSASR